MINKKSVLWIGLVGTVFLLGAIILQSGSYCYLNNFCKTVFSIVSLISFNILFFPIILFFSLITYKMNDQVFKRWVGFAVWYVPIYVIFVYLLKNSISGGDFGSIIGGWFDALLLLALLVLFFIISLIIIFHKSASSKVNKG